MKVSGKHIAILTHNYFEQSELEEPLSTLKNAGAEVSIISADGQELQGLQHVEKGDTFRADLLLEQASSSDYDALVVPGGAINADQLRVNTTAQQWVLDFMDVGRPIAVICHGPWLLVSADAVEGKRLTSYYTIQDDIVNAGGEWVDQPVVVDDNLVTSRKPDDLPAFIDALADLLSKDPGDVIRGGADTTIAATEQSNEAETRLEAMGYDKKRDNLSGQDVQEIVDDQDGSDPDQAKLRNVTEG